MSMDKSRKITNRIKQPLCEDKNVKYGKQKGQRRNRGKEEQTEQIGQQNSEQDMKAECTLKR